MSSLMHGDSKDEDDRFSPLEEEQTQQIHWKQNPQSRPYSTKKIKEHLRFLEVSVEVENGSGEIDLLIRYKTWGRRKLVSFCSK